MTIKYSPDNFLPPSLNSDDSAYHPDAATGSSLLHDFKQAIGLLVLLSALVTMVLHLLVPAI